MLTCITHNSTHYNNKTYKYHINPYYANVSVNCEYSLIRALLVQFRGDQLFYAKHYPVFAAKAYSSAENNIIISTTYAQYMYKPSYPLFSTALAAYSIWKTLPSGEYVAALRSYYKH